MIKDNVIIFAIGISPGISDAQLFDITHDKSRIFHISTFDELGLGIKNSITTIVCGEGPRRDAGIKFLVGTTLHVYEGDCFSKSD